MPSLRPRSFRASTLDEACARARAELGEDALILSAHETTRAGLLGLRRRNEVEVQAQPAGARAPADAALPWPLGGRVDTLLGDEEAGAEAEVAAALAREAASRGITLPELAPPEPALLAVAAGEAAPSTGSPAEPELAPPFENALAGAGLDALPLAGLGGSLAEELAGALADEPAAPAALLSGWPPTDALTDLTEEMPTLIDGDPVDGPATPTGARRPTDDAAEMSAFARIHAELASVRVIVEELALDRAKQRVESGPKALRDARLRLEEQGVPASLAVPALDRAAEALAPGARRDAILRTVERQLSARLPAVPTLDLSRSPTAIVLVGPGGAGKTTAAVRLGLSIAAEHGRRVTLAGMDVARAGAPQQLAAYGAAAGLPVRLCYTPGELSALLSERGSDVVIVDTAGHNGARRDRMAELAALWQAAPGRTVLLTLPATMKEADLLAAARAYVPAAPAGLLLTRVDETANYGALLSVACESGLGIAYTTHDEAATVAPRPGDNHALAVALLAGAWPVRDGVGNGRTAAGRRAG